MKLKKHTIILDEIQVAKAAAKEKIKLNLSALLRNLLEQYNKSKL